MKFSSVLNVLILLGVFVAPFCMAQRNSAGTGSKTAEAAVRRRIAEEVSAFLHNDAKAMDAIWSADLVVTNPRNNFINKQQLMWMANSGVLAITAYDRRSDYGRDYRTTVI